MSKFSIYLVVICGAVLLSTYLSAVMTRRKVNIGVRKFVSSTIGALAILLVWYLTR